MLSAVLSVVFFFIFFFKRKTSYEMRISDWSSDVCSSDLLLRHRFEQIAEALDDANIERFCNLLEAMTQETETRYLIVTHNAVTMSQIGRASCRERVCQDV